MNEQWETLFELASDVRLVLFIINPEVTNMDSPIPDDVYTLALKEILNKPDQDITCLKLI